MKKGIMLNFIFWTILALALFISTAWWASKIFSFNTRGAESFERLALTISYPELHDGDIDSMPLYLDDKSILVGFSKYSSKFEKHNYYPNNPNPDQIAFRFTRPISENCPIEKACICLCKDSYQGLQDPLPESTECNGPRCRAFDNIDFLPENIIEKDNDGSPKSAFTGGFLYFRGKNSPLRDESLGTRIIYIQRHKNIIAVCTSSPCISDESKAAINTAADTD